MAIVLNELEQVIDFIGDNLDHPYAPGDMRWKGISDVAGLCGLTNQGVLHLRRKFNHAFEHRVGNQVFIYFPKWLRLYWWHQSTVTNRPKY